MREFKDPIEIQCASEQMYGVTVALSQVCELDKQDKIGEYGALIMFRVCNLAHWLRDTCFDIDDKPTREAIEAIKDVINRIEALCVISLWQYDEISDKHVRNAVKDVIVLAKDCQDKAVELWGRYD